MQAPEWEWAQSATMHRYAPLNKDWLLKLFIKAGQEVVHFERLAASKHLQLLLLVELELNVNPKRFSYASQFITAVHGKIHQLLA